ncbi:MAG: efflux RND transporter permease subunit [Pseudomonadota bacterium]
MNTLPQRGNGIIGLFVRHRTAANVLMLAMIVSGIFAIQRINIQFFPTIDANYVFIEIPWSGATAADIETRIISSVVPKVRFLDNAIETIGTAREGSARISVEFSAGTDMQAALASVERAVASITTLPIDSEPPQILVVNFYEPVSKIAITGPFSEEELKRFARQMRDDLIERGIDQVVFVGLRGAEVAVLVPERKQREFGLSTGQIAEKIKRSVESIPSGTLDGDREIQLRSVGTEQTPERLAEIELRALPTGEKITVGDVAAVTQRFERTDPKGKIRGETAIELRVQRAKSADTLETMQIVDTYIAHARQTFPSTLTIAQYDNSGRYVIERIAVLVENGLIGLILVGIVLALFLDFRVAAWVCIGIPVSILGTFGFMWISGQTMNMVSVFGLIMMIGVIVDDAIVVGEHVATQRAAGLDSASAAELGTTAMLKPVIAATLTTQAAFVPIFLLTGPIGQVMAAIPMVVIAVLAASLLECFLVLPGHLAGGRQGVPRAPSRFRRGFDNRFAIFRDRYFFNALKTVCEWRYTFLAALVGLALIAAGTVMFDRLKAHFFFTPEPELVRANVTFIPGYPVNDQVAALRLIEDTLYTTEAELISASGGRLVEATFTTVGAYEVFDFVPLQNVAQLEIALTASESRDVTTAQFVKAWRAGMPPVAGVQNIAVSPVEPAGLPQRAIEVDLFDAPLADLKKGAEEVAAALARYDGVEGIFDNLPYGKQELTVTLTSRGEALGFTIEAVGRQIRDLVEGAIADRFSKNEEEVTIKVLRDDRGGRPDLNDLLLKGPTGAWVPLGEVATLTEVDSFAIIRHKQGGRRTVTVGADVDNQITSANTVVRAIEPTIKEIADRYGARYSFEGETREQAQSFEDFSYGLVMAGAFIYMILALFLESFLRPIFVLVIVPFGILGAIAGHLIMDLDLTIISFVGILGLSGILVNDSIIMIDRISKRIANGEDPRTAALNGSRDRLRAVVLTSVTTICGLLPIMFETSQQAQFLIPLAVTFVFGLLVSTFVVTFLIPVLFAISEDLAPMVERARSRFSRQPVPEE